MIGKRVDPWQQLELLLVARDQVTIVERGKSRRNTQKAKLGPAVERLE